MTPELTAPPPTERHQGAHAASLTDTVTFAPLYGEKVNPAHPLRHSAACHASIVALTRPLHHPLGLLLLVLTFLTGTMADARTPPDLRPVEEQADLIVVEKSERLLALFRDGEQIASYRIALGGGGDEGPKTMQGDARTPEGRYSITYRNAASRFHLSLRISYPTPAQRARAEAKGQNPGGDIMIHGLPNGWGWAAPVFLGRDWTNGCIAVTNRQMRDIWSRVPVGTRIEIRP